MPEISPNRIVYTKHAADQMLDRDISEIEVNSVIAGGVMAMEYLTDRPFPSYLLFAYVGLRPLHVVLAYDANDKIGYVVTAYEPDPGIWEDGYMKRRSQ